MATQITPQGDTRLRGTTQASLQGQGLTPSGDVYWNLVAPDLIEHAIRRGEGMLADMGPFVSVTSPHTGRSPNDKFVVQEPGTQADVDWGKVNQPITPEKFDVLLADVQDYLNGQEQLFVEDLFCGADAKYRLSVRYVSPNAWHMAFVRNMFIRPEAVELPGFAPNFTVLHAPEYQADPARHGTRSSTFIVATPVSSRNRCSP
jgi:phosphoenolpyruvate carboxykinase (ATP)